MKFNIAAKLGLLAAAVALLMTALVGGWSLRSARKVLTEREVANLTAETELRAFELVNEFRFLRKDLRDLATPPASLDEKMRPSAVFEMIKTLQTQGELAGMLLLTVDFEEYVRARTRHLPRHLTWLTDGDGRLLIHPDPQRQQQIRLASAGIEGDPPRADEDDALRNFAGRFKKT